ncbi:ATP-binding protein [Burkholderia cepacia]|nr:ATP-binding protein [Burkholderia cepacia]RQU03404.1 ATP-binding protein [Burkholderia cepacia]RQZ79915.1 ATP-binding protein [Burkholderia cepacia]RRA02108.1 ATP-binding protein [Burkholderia cepacia]RRA05304.1 ATP-binding protein [Burkholderia cepacia]
MRTLIIRVTTMTLELTRFSILGLHGKYDINIPIHDNRLILVGVNGLGKTTVISFLYFVLSDQWLRLLDYDFVAIEISMNGDEIVITKADVESKANSFDRYQKLMGRYAARSPISRNILSRIFVHPSFAQIHATSGASRDKIIVSLARDLEMSPAYLRRMMDDVPASLQADLFESLADPESLIRLGSLIKEAGEHQVIYLPTYRRIEQDLKAIFPNADSDDLKKLTSSVENTVRTRSRGYVELVQFGMQDVERKLADELETIQKRMREQLSTLTASYLQDIIRSRADKINPELIPLMSDGVVEKVLSRVEENTLSANDKLEVQNAIRRIRTGANPPEARDQYLTYFFSRLLEIYTDLYSSEEAIRNLVKTCNKYFVGKKLAYNDANFTSTVVDRDGDSLDWRVLSSGEKQVASLFTHLHLTKGTSQIVLIDEPELSLSVRWQKTLLPDISNSDNCKLLVAVTHSPFIYTNELDKYAVDLSKLIKSHSSYL